jgi:predicted Zn-dependent peptidase
VALIVKIRYKMRMSQTEKYDHRRLACGVDLAALPLPGRRTTSFDIRMLAGLAYEPEQHLGLARLVEETLGKGTSKYTAQQLTDAFDAIGAQAGSRVGRESFVFRCSCLPEYVETALELHAEMLCRPTFPEEFCRVAIDLGRQELTALEDDPGELARKMIAPNAFGALLGRHELGTPATLDRIKREHIDQYWRDNFSAARMQISVSGAVDVDRFAAGVDRLFSGFGTDVQPARDYYPVEFSPVTRHHQKELEQQQILICWPSLAVTHKDYPVEQLVLAMLSEGMSSRLFVEVREKLGLVYWVGAWDEHPRGSGMIFIGASTTPVRCDQTFRTLLREVDRLAEDVTHEELQRAKIGFIAKMQTHGDITRARVSDLSSDIFHYGRPLPQEEKARQISAVTIADVRRYLAENPRNSLCVQTLGTRPLEGQSR